MDANSSSEKPKWMQDPSLKGISMEKLDFLQKMVFESSSLSQKELMPFLMALAQKSRTANITLPAYRHRALLEATDCGRIRRCI